MHAVHFVAHALHLCFALTRSSLEGLPLFGLHNFVRLLPGAFLYSRAAALYATVVALTTYVHFVRRYALCSGGDCFGSVVVLRS